MNREDRKFLKIMKNKASKICAPDFYMRFNIEKQPPTPKNYKKPIKFRKRIVIIIASFCVSFVIGLWAGYVIHKSPTAYTPPNDYPTTDNPPVIDVPEEKYYMSGLTPITITSTEVESFCIDAEINAPLFTTLSDVLCYSYQDNAKNIVLGVGCEYSYYGDTINYIGAISILSNKIEDSRKDYQNLTHAFFSSSVNAWVSYKYIGIVDELHTYYVSFEKGDFVYLMQYSSAYQDLEAGFSTIF